MEVLLILLLGLAIDATLGDPTCVIHPVVRMGRVASFLVKGSAGRSYIRLAPRSIAECQKLLITIKETEVCRHVS